MKKVLYTHGRYEVHYIGEESQFCDETGELINDLIWDEEQRAYLVYGVYNTVIGVYEAYTPVEGSALIMAMEYQDLLEAARDLLKEKGTNVHKLAAVVEDEEVKH